MTDHINGVLRYTDPLYRLSPERRSPAIARGQIVQFPVYLLEISRVKEKRINAIARRYWRCVRSGKNQASAGYFVDLAIQLDPAGPPKDYQLDCAHHFLEDSCLCAAFFHRPSDRPIR